MKVVIVGLGLIGGSIALELKKGGFATKVIGVELNKKHAKYAISMGLVDEIKNIGIALKEADLVILAVSVKIITTILPKVLNSINRHTVVTDVGSTKEMIIKSVSNHPKRKQFVPSHPMAGTENSGPNSVVNNLFLGKTAVICNKHESHYKSIEIVKNMYNALGMNIIYMNAKSHDMHVAYVSHLSHISSFMLANTVLDIEKDASKIFNLASGGFESTVRLAKSSAEMWSDIFEQNSRNSIMALDNYINNLCIFRKNLINKKWHKIRSSLKYANKIKEALNGKK